MEFFRGDGASEHGRRFPTGQKYPVFRQPGGGGGFPPSGGGVFRAPARPTFSMAKKWAKRHLGAAAPKDPIDVQWSALFSFRRVDIALPLRPLPGLPLR